MVAPRLVLLVGLALACAACTPQGQCETQPTVRTVDYCKPGGTGCSARLKTPFEWHSNPIDREWIRFQPYQPIVMYLTDPTTGMSFAGHVDQIIPYVSASELANGSDAVIAAGNLAVFKTCDMDAEPTACIVITNETCATNYLRVIVSGH